tara:strand:+ start:74031 stop:75065 length:1035 start_codon:yes stop_codon:yes gene_type:complete
MPKLSNLPAQAGLFLLMSAVFLFDAPSLRAATGTETVPEFTRMAEAARRDDIAGLKLALVSAIASEPRRLDELVSYAVAAAPRHRNALAAAATAAFPAFGERIRAAANGTPVTTSGPTGAAALPVMPAAAPGKWSGEIELGGGRATGNTETEEVNAAAKIGYTRGPWEVEATASYDFAKDSGTINTQHLRLGGNAKYLFTDRAFVFGLIDYDDDRFSGFTYELTQAAGLGYKVIRSDDIGLEVTAGPALRLSEVKATGEQLVEPGARGGLELRWQVSDNATFTNKAAVTWGDERTITENTAALTMKVIGSLSGRLSYRLRHNSGAPAGTEATDTLTKVSLVYGF